MPWLLSQGILLCVSYFRIADHPLSRCEFRLRYHELETPVRRLDVIGLRETDPHSSIHCHIRKHLTAHRTRAGVFRIRPKCRRGEDGGLVNNRMQTTLRVVKLAFDDSRLVFRHKPHDLDPKVEHDHGMIPRSMGYIRMVGNTEVSNPADMNRMLPMAFARRFGNRATALGETSDHLVAEDGNCPHRNAGARAVLRRRAQSDAEEEPMLLYQRANYVCANSPDPA
jgi:hypothetical protein